MQIVGDRPSVLRGELVNKICSKEPVCLSCSEGLVNVSSRKEPVCLKLRKGSSMRIVGRSPSV